MIIPDYGNTARFSGVSPKSVCAFNALSLRGGLSLVEECPVYGYFYRDESCALGRFIASQGFVYCRENAGRTKKRSVGSMSSDRPHRKKQMTIENRIKDIETETQTRLN